MTPYYDELFESIRQKCEQEHWFGPKLLRPRQDGGIPVDDPNHFDFVFPPVNEQLIDETEECLKFSLPPLLHSLYTHIANGGFGPGTGLRGVCDGYGKPGTGIYPDDDGTIVAQYYFRSEKGTFAPGEYAHQDTDIELILPDGEWPEHVLPICDLGCVQEACVDERERMYIAAPVGREDFYGLYQLPWTFEEWLWRWVRNERLVN